MVRVSVFSGPAAVPERHMQLCASVGTVGAFTITKEIGILFLKDYLDGDLYFRTAYLEHNPIRALTQFALADDMKTKWAAMQEIVADIAKHLRC